MTFAAMSLTSRTRFALAARLAAASLSRAVAASLLARPLAVVG
jgi:hypothetical protein